MDLPGPLPKRIVVGMVDGEAYTGNFKKNPFNFQNFNIESINIEINGESPYKQLHFNYSDKSEFIRGYYSLFQSNSSSLINGNDISLNEYVNGHNLIAFNLAEDLCVNSTHFNPIKKGTLNLEIVLRSGPSSPVTVVIYNEYQNYFLLLKNGSEIEVLYNPSDSPKEMI